MKIEEVAVFIRCVAVAKGCTFRNEVGVLSKQSNSLPNELAEKRRSASWLGRRNMSLHNSCEDLPFAPGILDFVASQFAELHPSTSSDNKNWLSGRVGIVTMGVQEGN